MVAGHSARDEILRLARNNGSITQKDINDELDYSAPHISNVLVELEKEGEIERSQAGRTKEIEVPRNQNLSKDPSDGYDNQEEWIEEFDAVINEGPLAPVDEALDQNENDRNQEAVEKLNEIREARERSNPQTTSGENVTEVESAEAEDEVPEAEDLLEEAGNVDLIDTEEDSQQGIHKDNLHYILKVSRRRAVIRYLEENPEETPLEVSDLADEIAAAEQGVETGLVGADKRKQVYVGLYQTHMEQLDEYDIVNYDDERNTVERGENFEIAEEFVDDGFRDPEEYITLDDLKDDEEGEQTYGEAFIEALSGVFPSECLPSLR